jgi:hypothetical protein
MSVRRRIAVVFVSAAALVASAGCSGGSDDADDVDDAAGETTAVDTASPDTEPTDTEPDSTVDPDVDPADVAIAEAGLLTLDDMPQGWIETPIEDDADDEVSPAVEAAQEQFIACFGVSPDADGDPFGLGGARAATGEFADPRDFTITNRIAIADETGTERVFASYSAESIPECVAPAMVAVVEAGFGDDPSLAEFEVGAVTVERLELTEWGDGTIGYRTVVPVSSPDGSFELYMDQIVVRVGRGLSSLQFQSPNSPFEVFEVDSYAMLSAERLAEALG